MEGSGVDFQEREVRIQTVDGVVEGAMRMGARVRTLDDLNVVARTFVRVHEPVTDVPGWAANRQPLVLNKRGILFLTERTEFRREGVERRGPARAAMSLKLGAYVVSGFVNVPANGDPVMRLTQEKHPFLAVTSASIIGPGTGLAATFVAVNREHITMAQEMGENNLERMGISEEDPIVAAPGD